MLAWSGLVLTPSVLPLSALRIRAAYRPFGTNGC